MLLCFYIKSELEAQLMIANWERAQIFPKLLPIPLQGQDLTPARTEEEPMTQHVDLHWIAFTGFYSLWLLSSKNKSLSKIKKKFKRHLGGDIKKLPTKQPFWNNGNNSTYFSAMKELKLRCILTQINLKFPLCTIETENWRRTDVGRWKFPHQMRTWLFLLKYTYFQDYLLCDSSKSRAFNLLTKFLSTVNALQ